MRQCKGSMVDMEISPNPYEPKDGWAHARRMKRYLLAVFSWIFMGGAGGSPHGERVVASPLPQAAFGDTLF